MLFFSEKKKKRFSIYKVKQLLKALKKLNKITCEKKQQKVLSFLTRFSDDSTLLSATLQS